MKPGLFALFPDNVSGSTVIEWLNASTFDELIEIDVVNDRCTNIFHVEGKYHVPSFDCSYSELFDYSCEHMIHPHDRDEYRRLMNPADLLDNVLNAEYPGCLCVRLRYRLQNGKWRWTEKYVFAGSEYGLPEGILRSYVFDIQSLIDREYGKGLNRFFDPEANRDEKTGLYWERFFFDKANSLLEENRDNPWCVIAIDIEHFRLFNDWYGRDRGDLLLAKMGEALKDTARETGGLAGYLGQDDFCLVMPYDQLKITQIYKILSALFAELNTSIGFKPAFGVSIAEDDVPILDLIDRAKIALEQARKDYKIDICLFESKMLERSHREYQILLDFKLGIRNKEFIVYLQPQCRISSGKIIGVEALVRWRKANGDVVSPADFIPVLEKHGFITDLDRYVWREVCAQLRAWMDGGHEAVPVSVNVSQADFYTIDVAQYLDELTDEYNIPKSLFKVEITESTFAESAESVVEITKRLREKGFIVLMDDFGSGYSSLNMLSSLNVDVIKLDAAFLRMGVEDKSKGIHIVESIVNMAKTMALPIITEGVETKEQVEFLESLGCRFIQGFYYYRPMPIEDFEALINSGAEIDHRGFAAKHNEQLRVRELFDQSLYNDAMLNNILGPVAFYSWHGDEVDIVRFNEQFYEAANLRDVQDRLTNIVQYAIEPDKPRFMALLEQAQADFLNGSSGTIGFYAPDGSVVRFAMRAYFLGENGDGKLFYVSAHNITDVVDAQIESRILSDYFNDSIVLMQRKRDDWRFKVIVNGLVDVLGMSQEDIQAELDDGRAYKRLEPSAFEKIRADAHRFIREKCDFTYEFSMKLDSGEVVDLGVKGTYIPDEPDGITHVLAISAER